ncbi:MAG: response regulator [Candidatus Eisenbacteria bacterium]
MAKLLLVEDEPAQLDFYRCLLAEDGHEIEEAKCGREAIEVAKRFCPSIVVIDLVLPDMDGTETISRLLKECGRPKIIINTGYSSYRFDFRCWGADAFVVKSSDPSELRAKVRQVLSAGPGGEKAGRESRN